MGSKGVQNLSLPRHPVTELCLVAVQVKNEPCAYTVGLKYM